jgi:hypothetical protein
MTSFCTDYQSVPITRWANIKIKFKSASKLSKNEIETFDLIHTGNGNFSLREGRTHRPYEVKKGGLLKGKNSFTVKGMK